MANKGYIAFDTAVIGAGAAGFMAAITAARNGRSDAIIEHKDRLTRFQFKFIKKMFESYGCEVIVINGMDVSDTEELAADMMSLLASFSGKFYGKRRKKKKNEKVQID